MAKPGQGAPNAPGIKACCQDADNLVRTSEEPLLTVDTCQVCGCRHFRAMIPLRRITSPGQGA